MTTDELSKLAMSATPGPWGAIERPLTWTVEDERRGGPLCLRFNGGSFESNDNDAQYIAA